MDGNAARALDRADQEIDAFIEKRHAEREKANAEAEEGRKSEERYERQKRDGHLAAWMDFYLRQAEVYEELAAAARERAWALDGGP